MIPPLRFRSEVRLQGKKFRKIFSKPYLVFGLAHYFPQNHFYAAYRTETATPGYTLVRASLGTDIVHDRKMLCSIFINIENLTNAAYQNHLSRLKYTGYNYNTGREGVFNMGRNVSIKVLVPLTL